MDSPDGIWCWSWKDNPYLCRTTNDFKKIVKVGDIIIRKREVTTREKIDVHIIKEKIFVENPGEKK